MEELHPSIESLYRWLQASPRLPDSGRRIADRFQDLATYLMDTVPDGPEFEAALRKLLEAKDCAVRASLTPPTLPSDDD